MAAKKFNALAGVVALCLSHGLPALAQKTPPPKIIPVSCSRSVLTR